MTIFTVKTNMEFSSISYFIHINVLLLHLEFCTSFPTGSLYERINANPVCGYESCPKVDPNKLNVHLVAHTHDDVGWVKTLDQYYYGSHNSIQYAGVQYIIASAIDALLKDSKRRFIYVETAFFWKWWVEQTEEMQHVVKYLVNEGRLEFAGGAWSMNDEAATHYHSTIDQFTWGLRKLKDTFGDCGRPRIGWQIDPFGHSREMASMFYGMGYDGFFFARMDYQDKQHRLNNLTAEFLWKGSANLDKHVIFTSVLYKLYNAPKGFCFDVLCREEPIIDDKRSADYNVNKKVEDFISFVRQQASGYASNNILITMGGDFYYQEANRWFINLDKLIKYVNSADPSINLLYSTPSCYLKAVNDADLSYTTKEDDFFPYASDANSYWTGYFTSRPTIKYFERLGNNFLQVSKQLKAMAQLGQVGDSPLDSLREAMGVMQHHDAITGTEKQHVANDYARLLSNGFEDAREEAERSLNELMSNGASNIEFHNCLLLNVSKCNVSENNDQFVVTVYNPVSRNITHFVRIPVQPGTYSVKDPNENEQTVQLIPIPEQVLNVPERVGSLAMYDLVFRAEDLPPLGYRSYYITKTNAEINVQYSQEYGIGNTVIQVNVDPVTGLVNNIITNGDQINLDQRFLYYEGSSTGRASGAYIFRPKYSEPNVRAASANITVYKGDLVEEIHQTFTSWVSQIIRVYKEENYVEFEWMVGPIPVEDSIGKEVISRFTTDLQTDGVFYTDSNGRELLERKRNFRSTWNFTTTEPVSANYYPVTSKILIRDERKGQEVAVLNDRAQGGSSLKDGQIELMVHRRLLHDDRFGVGEVLNEKGYGQGLIARGKHYVVSGAMNGVNPSMAAQERELAQRKLLSPWLFFSYGGPSFEAWKSGRRLEFSGLTESLPPNVQILTLEPWNNGKLLLRLEHILEKNEDTQLSKSVSVSFETLFSDFKITSIKELTLGANQQRDNVQRFVWTSNSATPFPTEKQDTDTASATVSLTPMEIRTYEISVAKYLRSPDKQNIGDTSNNYLVCIPSVIINNVFVC